MNPEHQRNSPYEKKCEKKKKKKEMCSVDFFEMVKLFSVDSDSRAQLDIKLLSKLQTLTVQRVNLNILYLKKTNSRDRSTQNEIQTVHKNSTALQIHDNFNERLGVRGGIA